MNQTGILPVEAVIKPAKYSMNELLETNKNIDIYTDRKSKMAAEITMFGLLEDENKVFIGIKNLTDEKKNAVLEELADSIEPEMIKFEEIEQVITTSANLGGGCYRPSNMGEHHLSIGFRAQKVIGGVAYNGFVTAGHGMEINGQVYDLNRKKNW